MRTVASRELPIASTVSAELQALMAGVPEPSVDLATPQSVPEWLRQAGVALQLEAYEGQSHGQYLVNSRMPETSEAFADIARFSRHACQSSPRQASAR